MKIGISTACFYSLFMTEQALEFMGKAGVKQVEIFLDSQSEYEADFGEVLQGVVQKYGLDVVSIHAMSTQYEPQLFSLSVRQKKDAWQAVRKVLAQGKKLGAKHYVFHGPATMGGVLKNASLERIAPITADLADLAGTYGIKLCWENVSWCLFCAPQFATQLLSLCPSDNLHFCLDIKQAIRSGYSPFDYLDAMGERVAHVHLLDYIQSEDGLRLVMPARGEFDFVQLRDRLIGQGYEGALMLECYSDLYKTPQEVIASWGELRGIDLP